MSDPSSPPKFRSKRHFIREGEVDKYLCRYVVDLITSEEVGGIRFAVFLDEDLGIQWYARDEEGVCHESSVFTDNFDTILNNVVHLETLSASLRRLRLSPRPAVETMRKVHQRIAEVSQQLAEREAQGGDDGGATGGGHSRAAMVQPQQAADGAMDDGGNQKDETQEKPVDLGVTTVSKAPESGEPIDVDDNVLYQLRSAHPELRATRRLIAESLARTYVLPLPILVEQHRQRAAVVAAKALEGLTGTAHDELKRSLAEGSKAAEEQLVATYAVSRDRAGTAADECLEMARKYLTARSTDLGREHVLLGALAALVIMTIAFVFSFNDYESSTKFSVQDHVADRIAKVRLAIADPNNTEAVKADLKKSLELLTARQAEIETKGGALRPAMLDWLEFESAGLRDQIKAEGVSEERKKNLQRTLDVLEKQQAEILEKPKSSWINDDGMNILASSAIGALGAMLSLLMGAASRPYDAGAGRLIHWLEGITRIVVGVLGACFITLGLQSGFFLGFLKDGSTLTQKFFYLQLLLGFTAGLSERLVPSFITIVEAQVQGSGGGGSGTTTGKK